MKYRYDMEECARYMNENITRWAHSGVVSIALAEQFALLVEKYNMAPRDIDCIIGLMLSERINGDETV